MNMTCRSSFVFKSERKKKNNVNNDNLSGNTENQINFHFFRYFLFSLNFCILPWLGNNFGMNVALTPCLAATE